jgi:hypothetical protein
MADAQPGVCSMCRQPIQPGPVYYRCSVSTCNSGRLRLVFCSLACWDAHLPGARHRDAWAVVYGAPAGARPNRR